jgi:sigma-54 specific flagellar transcriptional regulator A
MPEQKYILVVDNNSTRRNQMETVLAFIGESYHVFPESDIVKYLVDIPNILAVVLCGEISEHIASIIKSHPACPFIYHDLIDKQQVRDYSNIIGELAVPLNYGQLTEMIHHSHQYHNNLPNKRRDNCPNVLFRSLVGTSEPMQQVRFLIEQVATTAANVLILGESGTGKEVVARNIHNLSDRAKGPFVPVNCGAIPPDLLESELFGHEKGAFTGAISTRKGRFEMAEGGTLFLDEIGDMPQPMQVKLLRVLQERTFERIGGSKSIKANVRIIAATHQHLEEMIKTNQFREDLYYRLNVFPIDTPALRERKGDIPLLMNELISRFTAEQGHTVRFTEMAIESLKEHQWLGNVRELSNLIERMIIMYSEQVVDVGQLPIKYRHVDVDDYQPDYPEELQERDAINELFAGFDYDDEDEDEEATSTTNADTTSNITILPTEGFNLKDYLAELEVSLVTQSLDVNEWVVARAAETLGMRRTTLVEKMRKYSLQKN